MKALRQHIRKLSKEQFLLIKKLCKHSNSLYNSSLYICNEYYRETGKYIGHNKLYHTMKQDYHYKQMPARLAQQTIRLVDKNYRSFFALLRRKARGQYPDDVNSPKYKKSGGEYILIAANNQVNLRNGKIKILKQLKIPFKGYEINGKIRQAVIKPKGRNYYELILSYEEKNENKPKSKKLKKRNCLSIDLGVNNFVSCFSNAGPNNSNSFIVGGGSLKSYNQNYNKRKAKIQSELKKCNKNKHWSNKLERLNINRKNWIDNYFNQTISLLMKYCVKNEIGKVVCGYNEGWKQKTKKVRKANNQNFQSIPYWLFKRKLESKCEDLGIQFVQQEESYTSLCSFLDNERVSYHKEYLGKRIKRGLFKTKEGKLVNADINAAANILKKAVPKAVNKLAVDGIEGCIVSPVKLKNIFDLQSINHIFL